MPCNAKHTLPLPVLLTLALAALAAAQGCGGNTPADPLRTAIETEVKRTNPSLEWFSALDIEHVTDVTLSQELTRRTALMRKKVQAEKQLSRECRRRGETREAREHDAAAGRSRRITAALDRYASENAARADSVIYSVYAFRGRGETAGGENVTDARMLCTVSPGLRVYNVVPEDGGDVYGGMGVAIPGYRELVTQFREDKEKQPK